MKRGFLNTKKAKAEPLYPKASQPTPAPAAEQRLVTDWRDKSIKVTPAPYGKVEGMAPLPDDYKGEAGHRLYTENDVVPSDSDPYVVVTIPVSPEKAAKSDGLSQWITRLSTKTRFLKTLGASKPLPKPRLPDLCAVMSTPTMGKGLYATRDLKLGELIFAERPLLCGTRGIPVLDSLRTKYTKDQIISISLYEWEKNLETALSRMSPENQTAYKELMNNHMEDGSGPLLGIYRTNGYSMDLRDGADEMQFEDGRNEYSCIGKLGSRINHSCMPNIKQSFDREAFALLFRASRNIKSGEQLFYCYCSDDVPVQKRRKELEAYGILCQCAACVNATSESDKLRQEFYPHIQNLYERRLELVADPMLNLKSLDPLLKLEKDLIKEGLNTHPSFLFLLCVIQQMYAKLNIHSKTQEYTREIVQWS